jgi:hypothetical protein
MISIIRPIKVDVDDSPISSCILNWWNVSEIEFCESWYLTLVLREVDGLEIDIFSSSVKSPIDLLVLLQEDVFEDWKIEISSSWINLGIDLFLLWEDVLEDWLDDESLSSPYNLEIDLFWLIFIL